MTHATMMAAVLHAAGQPLRIERIPQPEVRPHDVIVKVEACGVIPNMNNVLAGLRQTLPPLPAVVGLDAAGVVSEIGEFVTGLAPGDRVYINPTLSCGTCRHCHAGDSRLCSDMALRGYFGFTPGALNLMREYPWGGYAEYTLAPQRNLLKLPDGVTFEQAARFGYMGTAYAAVRQANIHPGSWVLINGATGTLGVSAVMFALASGASRILAVGRSCDALARVKALSPRRVVTLALGDEPLTGWIRAETGGYGPDVIIECTTQKTPPTVLQEALACLTKGGIAVNVGGLASEVGINPTRFMNSELHLRGSSWFEMSDIEEMAEIADKGIVDFSIFDTQAFSLNDIGRALDAVLEGQSGFTNVVVKPHMH